MNTLDSSTVLESAFKVLASYPNIESTLFKSFRADVASHMNVSVDELKTPEMKNLLKTAITEMLEKAEMEKEKEKQVATAEKTKKREKSSTKTAHRKPAKGESKYDLQLQILTKMQRAAGLGPSVFRGLPEDKIERVNELSERLKAAGAKFSGKIPSVKEIADAKKKTQLKKDLEGIDTSNIIERSSRRRRPRYVVKDDMDDEEESEEDNDDDEEFRTTKRSKKIDDDDDEVSDDDTNMESDDGEEEFAF